MINAFCLPGGEIAVFTGVLPVTKNEDGLAVIISHEVAPATLQHGDERISQPTNDTVNCAELDLTRAGAFATLAHGAKGKRH